jgi:hypothetical protein
MLSVSSLYLALDGIYHQFTLQSQGTRLVKSQTVRSKQSVMNGIITLHDALFQETFTDVTTGIQLSHISWNTIGHWAIPGSLAVTRGILVSFFSSAYLYA